MAIDKKIAVSAVLAVAVLILIGWGVIRFAGQASKVENLNGGAQAESSSSSSSSSSSASISVEIIPEGQEKGFSFCLDKCGDGVCQAEVKCANELNCICPETKQDCLKDCK